MRQTVIDHEPVVRGDARQRLRAGAVLDGDDTRFRIAPTMVDDRVFVVT